MRNLQLEALRVKDLTVRCFAAVAFEGFDPAAVPALIEMFRDEDRNLHTWVSTAIIQIGKKAEPHLLKARDDKDPVVRANVAQTLKDLKEFGDLTRPEPVEPVSRHERV